ncbi:MAG: DNA polymerase, partial [Alphaproteobacteria bacterium]|nr:DNA polymerase [Alphaproteobacteria bacterium]
NVSIFKDTFNKNQDIHEQTARKIFNISPEQTVPAHLRRAAKTVNFSIIYGISPWGLSAQLGITKDEAKNIIQSYMDSIPEIYDYIERTKQFALDNAFVLTPWGRRIELPDVKIPRLKTYALRAAINAPVQGFEADLMRKVMVDIYHKIIQKNKDKIRMIVQVHDEIIFECKTEYTEQFASQIKNIMETIVKLSVPLVAEVNINKLWSK